MQKVKQQQMILIVAMYILKKNGYITPPKKQVLGFIRVQDLMRIPKEDKSYRNREQIWENDIAWKRKDLLESGLIVAPEHDAWKLTDYADGLVEKQKEKWSALSCRKERNAVLSELGYFSENLLEWMYKIAIEANLSLDSKT